MRQLCYLFLKLVSYYAIIIHFEQISNVDCSLVTKNQKLNSNSLSPLVSFLSQLESNSNAQICNNQQLYYEHVNKVCNSNSFLSPFQRPVADVTKKYILYDVNTAEGFNLRRDVYIRMAKLVKLLNNKSNNIKWILVLPPWTSLYHWSNRLPQKKLKWSEFFNVQSLNDFVPVIEMDDFIKINKWKIDQVLYLKNFQHLEENSTWLEKAEFQNCDQIDSYYKKADKIKGTFWTFKKFYANSLNCVSFQGAISFMANQLVNKDLSGKRNSSRSIMIDRAEIMLHDSYGDIEYWKCRRSMRFSTKLVKKSLEIRSNLLNSNDFSDKTEVEDDWRITKRLHGTAIGGPYLAVHLRRGDFLYSRKSIVVSLKRVAQQVGNILLKLNLSTIYLATDSTFEEINELKTSLKEHRLIYYRPEDYDELYEYKDGGVAIIDQLVCAHARYFVGSYESTFSFRIQEEREILGFDVGTTFNRLCYEPERFNCESTKWLIKYD